MFINTRIPLPFFPKLTVILLALLFIGSSSSVHAGNYILSKQVSFQDVYDTMLVSLTVKQGKSLKIIFNPLGSRSRFDVSKLHHIAFGIDDYAPHSVADYENFRFSSGGALVITIPCGKKSQQLADEFLSGKLLALQYVRPEGVLREAVFSLADVAEGLEKVLK